MKSLSELLAKEWFLGFLSGVGATVLGFGLTILWDLWKMRRERLDRDQAVSNAVSEELASNKHAMQNNRTILDQDLKAIPQRMSVIQPLSILKTGFWDVAKINPPARFLESGRMAKVRDLAVAAEQVNEVIRSREDYRIHNGAMSSFHDTLKIYDEIILEKISALAKAVEAYEKPGFK